ncbi:MAG: HAD-IIIA family hydrolase [Verrucomicrobiales bacterium]|nr:HAD-IIIA family hydrolase [Verrucomicrobiales bacterium]
MRSAVFFERDGILNLARVAGPRQIAPTALADFHINPQAEEPLRQLKAAGYLLLATTNQPGLSQGSQSRHELDLMHGQLVKAFRLDGVLLCPHSGADDCPCRKPKAGLILEAAFKWHLDLERSFVISDKWQDAKAAHIAGCTSILVKSPWIGSGHHDFVVADIAAAAGKILRVQPSAVVRSTCNAA